jgi:type I restriction enzyme S subunit
LRFPGFEGEWIEKRLGEVATNKSAKYNPNNSVASVKCIELEHLATHNGTLLGYIDGSQSGSIKNKFSNGDVLFGKLRPYLRKYLHAPFNGVCSSEIWVLRGKTISNDFLYRIIQTEKFIDLANQSSGSKMPRADWDVVENGVFSVPNALEQQKISAFLSLIENRINTQNKIIRELYVLKNVFSERIFSQELRFQDNNASDFPAWELKKLKEVCDINPKVKSIPNSFYYIDLESVVNGRLLKEVRVLKDEAPSRAQRVLAKNDVLFQMVRPYQKNNLFFDKKGEYVASTGYAQIRAKQSSQFVYQYLHNQKFVDKVIERCTGTSYPAISSTDLGNIEIYYPSLAEQIKIADFLSSIDTKIDLENQLLEKLGDQKNYLLANLLT